MKAKRQARTLIVFIGVFALLGIVLDLWFYAIAATVMGLYTLWCLFAIEHAVKRLRVEIHRSADVDVAQRGDQVAIELSIASNMGVTGILTDVVPDGVTVIDGTNLERVVLRKEEVARLRYALEMTERAGLRLEVASLVIENTLFTHTFRFTQGALNLQPLAPDASARGATGSRRTSAERAGRAAPNVPVRPRTASERSGVSHVRPYDGDPSRYIHWKASAKLGKLMTKEFLFEGQDTNLEQRMPICLVIDQSGSMGIGMPGKTAIDLSIDVARHLLHFATEWRNPVGLVTYDDDGIVTAIDPGQSAAHVSQLVTSLSKLEPRTTAQVSIHGKSGLMSVDVHRLHTYFSRFAADDEYESARFREIVSYLYDHEEGYHFELERAPAFKALKVAVSQASSRSVIVIISDLEGDLDPIIEGARLALYRGSKVYLIAVFSEALKGFEDRFIAAEQLYANYERFEWRLGTVRSVSGIEVIEALSPESLQLGLRKVKA
jgi:uncharacterized protein (DUF58 family)